MDLADNESNTEAMEKYRFQMNLLLQHIFRDDEEDLKKPDNWISTMQNLVGGKDYQHAHADQGRPMAFRDQTIYPFVAQHGFGRYAFQLWLLPNNSSDIKNLRSNGTCANAWGFCTCGWCLDRPSLSHVFLPSTRGRIGSWSREPLLAGRCSGPRRRAEICHFVSMARTPFPFCISFRLVRKE